MRLDELVTYFFNQQVNRRKFILGTGKTVAFARAVSSGLIKPGSVGSGGIDLASLAPPQNTFPGASDVDPSPDSYKSREYWPVMEDIREKGYGPLPTPEAEPSPTLTATPEYTRVPVPSPTNVSRIKEYCPIDPDKINRYFGWIESGPKKHLGHDLGCPVGTPANAIYDGKVRSIYLDEYGNHSLRLQCFDSDCGIEYFSYRHLDFFHEDPKGVVFNGQNMLEWHGLSPETFFNEDGTIKEYNFGVKPERKLYVKGGDPVGFVGMTGNATWSHLHIHGLEKIVNSKGKLIEWILVDPAHCLGSYFDSEYFL